MRKRYKPMAAPGRQTKFITKDRVRRSTGRARPGVLFDRLESRMLLASPVSGELAVNLTTARDQAAPAIAMDGDGDFVVAWSSAYQDGDGTGIYARQFRAGGWTLGGEFRVNTTTADHQNSPVIGMDADGDFAIAWSSANQDGTQYGVYARRYNAAGTSLGNEFRVSSLASPQTTVDSITMAPDGRFVITWSSLGQDGSGLGVYARRYGADGAPVGDEFRVNTFATHNQSFSQAAINSSGQFVVAWDTFGPDESGLGIAAQRYSPEGAPIGGELNINAFTAGHQELPAVAISGTGGFVVAWQSAGQDGSGTGVYARRYSAAGTPAGDEFRVNTTTEGDQRNAAITMHPTGGFVIAWESADADGSGIYAQEFDAAGQRVGSEFQVNTTTAGNQQRPNLAMDPAGNLAVTWESDGQDGSGDGVMARRYAVDVPPVASIEVDPQAFPLDEIRVVFSESVSGLDLSDLSLTRNDGPNLLTAEQTLFSMHGRTWTLGNLAPLTVAEGAYRLTLRAAESNIVDRTGQPLMLDASAQWVNGTTRLPSTAGDDTYRVRRSSDGLSLEVYYNAAEGSAPTYVLALASIGSLTIDGAAGNDSLVADFAQGSIVPTGGMIFTGGDGSDLIRVIGTSGDDAFSATGAEVRMGSSAIAYQSVEQVVFDGGTGNDSLNVTGSLPFTPTLTGSGLKTMTVQGGTHAFAGDLGPVNLVISGDAAVEFASTQHLASLNISAGSGASVAPVGTTLISTSSLAIETGATLDLADNAMVIRATPETRDGVLAQVEQWIALARNASSGQWTEAGLTSSAAAADPLTGLAAILNNSSGQPIKSTFLGESVDANSILIQHTLNGDTDLSGRVDAADYFLVDSGFVAQSRGYRNGDLDYNGRVDAADYFLIDSAFLGQSGALAASPAQAVAAPTVGATATRTAKVRRQKPTRR